MIESKVATDPVLDWAKIDFEQRFGFNGGRFTSVNSAFTFCIAVVFAILFYLIVIYGLNSFEPTVFLADMFLKRGPVQYPTVFLAFWCIAILVVKRKKIDFQRRALDLKPFPVEPSFLLTPSSAQDILAEINRLVDDPKHFVLFNRIERALSNLRNIGRISDVSDILQTQAEYDEAQQDSSFRLMNGFIWAIPVLGFIGTVLGLSQSIGGFGKTLADLKTGPEELKASLGVVTDGLSQSFETTLVALVAALIVQIWMTFTQQRESLFLDECSEYCHAHVVSKLRLTED